MPKSWMRRNQAYLWKTESLRNSTKFNSYALEMPLFRKRLNRRRRKDYPAGIKVGGLLEALVVSVIRYFIKSAPEREGHPPNPRNSVPAPSTTVHHRVLQLIYSVSWRFKSLKPLKLLSGLGTLLSA